MSFWVDPKVKVGTNKQYDYMCDEDADISDLPTSEDEVEIGASCLSIESGDLYILNSSRTWVRLGG